MIKITILPSKIIEELLNVEKRSKLFNGVLWRDDGVADGTRVVEDLVIVAA